MAREVDLEKANDRIEWYFIDQNHPFLNFPPIVLFFHV